MRVFCVGGARPNFPKLKPVIDALERLGHETRFVHTGQHYDAAMSGRLLEEIGLREPDHFLGVGSGSHAWQTARVMEGFEPLMTSERPDMVLVVGDVNSTVACALVAAKAGALVAHVEAGLRSRDWAMPEEINRVVTDRLSDYLFAPSADAAANLRDEGYRTDQIHLVGNVMVDTLFACLDRARAGDVLNTFGLHRGGYGLVTLHRPSNVDDPQRLQALVGALGRITTELPIVFPVHPRTRSRLAEIGTPDGIVLIEPAGYLDFLALQDAAAVVLTDSGGVQEETTALGVACLTLRPSTERPITITEGTNRLVGTDPEAILDALRDVLNSPPAPRCPALWDGHAAPRIAAAITDGEPATARLRPTDLVPAALAPHD